MEGGLRILGWVQAEVRVQEEAVLEEPSLARLSGRVGIVGMFVDLGRKGTDSQTPFSW